MTSPSPALRGSQVAFRALRSSAANPVLRQPRTLFSPLVSSNSSRTTPNPQPRRHIHTTPPASRRPRKPLAHNREEVPDQPPPTDFGKMDILASTPVPSTAVEVCRRDGFELNSGVLITGGSGVLLVGGEAFSWRPWELRAGRDAAGGAGTGTETGTGTGTGTGKGATLLNDKGQWEAGEEAFGLLGSVWPRPDLLILGLGPSMKPLSPTTRQAISNLGMRVEVLDTRNAAAQYNLLATERGMDDVAAALIPLGWKESGKK